MASYFPSDRTCSESSSIGYLPVVYELDGAIEIHKLREPVAIIAATYDGGSLVRHSISFTSPGSLYRKTVAQCKELLRLLD